MEQVMKLYLAIHHQAKYMHDPDVQSLWRLVKRQIKSFKFKHQYTNLELFVQIFKNEYKYSKQITNKELSYFITFAGTTDERSIQNKINYLISKGVLKPVTPNTFNIHIEQGVKTDPLKDRLWYMVNENLKKDFEKHVIAKYMVKTDKKGNCRLEIEKATKLYLAINQKGKYMQDPSIQLLLNVLKRRIKEFKAKHQHTDLELFSIMFKHEYQDREQVTSRELYYFTTFVEGITDEGHVQNSISYLISKGY